jgi:hypothetical protein
MGFRQTAAVWWRKLSFRSGLVSLKFHAEIPEGQREGVETIMMAPYLSARAHIRTAAQICERIRFRFDTASLAIAEERYYSVMDAT